MKYCCVIKSIPLRIYRAITTVLAAKYLDFNKVNLFFIGLWILPFFLVNVLPLMIYDLFWPGAFPPGSVVDLVIRIIALSGPYLVTIITSTWLSHQRAIKRGRALRIDIGQVIIVFSLTGFYQLLISYTTIKFIGDISMDVAQFINLLNQLPDKFIFNYILPFSLAFFYLSPY